MSERGQLVLVAALALAAALVPLAFAYLQLGYQAQVAVADDPVAETHTALGRAIEDAADGIPRDFSWGQRARAVDTLRERLRPTLSTLNRSRLDAGTATAIRYNATRARTWAARNCPGGPDRQFGPCRASDGVVVQERAGRAHVLAVGFDVTVTGPGSERAATIVVEAPMRS